MVSYINYANILQARMYALLTVVIYLVVGAKAAPAADEITNLPGLDFKIPFKHYSGYLNGVEGKHLHYW